MRKRSPDAVSQAIQKLLADRQSHLDAIDRIESTLSRVGAALMQTAPRRGRPPKAAAADQPRKRRRRRRYATTGDESILGFIRQNKNPTTQQIKQHWQSEHRGGSADNVLSRLVSVGQLKREALKEGRGSRYSIA